MEEQVHSVALDKERVVVVALLALHVTETCNTLARPTSLSPLRSSAPEPLRRALFRYAESGISERGNATDEVSALPDVRHSRHTTTRPSPT